MWRPIKTQQGRSQPALSIDSTPQFLSAVFDTMQNWVDNSLSRAPGQRDRICTIRLRPGEGGRNLDMPPSTIDRLVPRGRAAGRNLAWIRRGTSADWKPATTDDEAVYARQWDRHRFARFRTFFAGLGYFPHDANTGMAPTTSRPDDDYQGVAVRATKEGRLPYRAGWTRSRQARVRESLANILSGDVSAMTDTAPAGSSLGYNPNAAQRPGPEPTDNPHLRAAPHVPDNRPWQFFRNRLKASQSRSRRHRSRPALRSRETVRVERAAGHQDGFATHANV